MTDSKIYIDTAPFIYYLEKNTLYFDRIRNFFMQCHSDKIPLETSVITFEEYCVYPLSIGSNQSIANFEKFIEGMNINVLNIDKQIAFEAAKIRSKYQTFKALDSIHLATAIMSGCKTFITNDKQLRQIQELNVVTMDDLQST